MSSGFCGRNQGEKVGKHLKQAEVDTATKIWARSPTAPAPQLRLQSKPAR